MLIEKVLETDVGIIKVVVIAHSKSCVLSISSDPLALGSLSILVPCLDVPGTAVGVTLLDDGPCTCERLIEMLSAKYNIQIILNSKIEELVWAERSTNKLITQTLVSLFEEIYKPESKQ
ncbi:hypothetical protein GL50803_0019364 [Giardia duodenalis]|uniref:Uncharacterized protein n=1 Tax=Giardia intestinalis (strain ATCC 50803 / WB clone C6) TaxID=184922 RepID=D3KGW5_GIAIC|nr:hypothetical protein GL50803_0019364 [Giardia intestinalis]KAE8305216.1 hypothetical protein GL50803_0019364 [Giardia intestinalis]